MKTTLLRSLSYVLVVAHCVPQSSVDVAQSNSADSAPVEDATIKPQSDSKSRLSAAYFIGGGAQQLSHIDDSQLGFRCLFWAARDGKMRCLPLDHIFVPLGGYYLDSACTDGFFYWTNSWAPPRYFVISEGEENRLQIWGYGRVFKKSVYQTGVAVTAPSTLYYKSYEGGCLTINGGGPGYHFTEADPTIFAEGTLQ